MFLTHFLKGIECFFTGATRFYSDKSLLKYAVIPFLLMLGAYGVFLSATVILSSYLAAKAEAYSAGLPAWINWAAKGISGGMTVVIFIIALCFSILTASSLYEIFAGPFFDSLIIRYEKKYYNINHPQISFYRMLRLQLGAVWYSIKTLLLSCVLFLPALLFPVFGALLMCLVIGYRLGVAFSIPPALLQNRSVKAQQLLNKGKKAAILGFGMMVYLLFLLPFAPLFLLPGVILGGAEIQKFISDSTPES